MWDTAKTVLITAVVTSLSNYALWLAFFQRRWHQLDKRQQDAKETSAAQIADRQVLSSELWKRIEKLEEAEREMINERIQHCDQIADLKADKKTLTQLSIEQHEEIIILRARAESLDLQLQESKKNSLESLMKEYGDEKKLNP